MGKNKRLDSLSESKRNEIKNLIESGLPYKSVAKQCKVDIGNVTKIGRSLGIVGCQGFKYGTEIEREYRPAVEPRSGKIYFEPVPLDEIKEEVAENSAESTTQSALEQAIQRCKNEGSTKTGRKPRVSIKGDIKIGLTEAIEEEVVSGKLSISDFCEKYCISRSTFTRLQREYNFDLSKAYEIACNRRSESRQSKVTVANDTAIIEKKKETTPVILKEDEEKKTKSIIIMNTPKIVSNKKEESPHQIDITRGNLSFKKIQEDAYIIRAMAYKGQKEKLSELYIVPELDSNCQWGIGLIHSAITKFIDEWISFIDGKASKSLEVYVDETVPILVYTDLIQTCINRHVNLMCLLYNKNSGTWYSYSFSPVFEQAVMNNSNLFKYFNSNVKFSGLYTYGDIDFEKIDTVQKFYLIKKLLYKTPDSKDYYKGEYIITNTLPESFEVYAQIVQEFKTSGESGIAVVSEVSATKEGSITYIETEASCRFNMNSKKQ